MLAVLPWLIAGSLLLLLVVWAGTRSLGRGPRGAAGAADALGGFIDAFDPARARTDRELQSLKHQGPVTPSPDDEDGIEETGRVRLELGPDGRPRSARVRGPGIS